MKINIQTVYDDRRKTLFVSVLGGPAAEWFDSLDAALTWDEIKTQFIARFTDRKMQYRFRIEAENLKRQPDENIENYIHRINTLVDKGWPSLPMLMQMREQHVEINELESIKVTLYVI